MRFCPLLLFISVRSLERWRSACWLTPGENGGGAGALDFCHLLSAMPRIEQSRTIYVRILLLSLFSFVRVSPGLWSGCASLGIQNQGLQTGSALESRSSKPQVSLSQLLLFRAGHGFFAGTATWLHKLIKTA